MQRTIHNLSRPPKKQAKKTHAEVKSDIEKFLDAGGQIEHLEGFKFSPPKRVGVDWR